MKALKQFGFTLIEMAIVLVIIGVILGAVMKGTDILQGSQVKKITQGYVQQWLNITALYYDRTGQYLVDGGQNGGSDLFAAPDGRMDNELIDVNSTIPGNRDELHLLNRIEAQGIYPCDLIKTDQQNWAGSPCGDYNIYEHRANGGFSGPENIIVGFMNVDVVGTGGDLRNKNSLIFVNVPSDVASGIDKIIDGVSDGESGRCLCPDGTDITTPTFIPTTPGDDVDPDPWPNAEVGGNATFTTVLVLLDF